MKVKKQKRQAAVLTAVQLGAVLVPLTQMAQADALDDAVTSAKAKGFDASVSDQPAEKVASKKVAEAKTAESKAQVEKDAQALTKAVSDFEAQDAQVKRENEERTKAHEGAVKAENARVQTAEDANKAIEAENAKAQQAYEAEKAKVEADNAAAQKAYETEKAKVEADNKAKLAQYETALKQAQAENQKLQADYEVAVKKGTDAKVANDAELKRVEAENAKNKAQYEADLKRITAERDALTKQYEADKARIEKENADNKAAVDAANAKIEADYQKAKADYDAEVARIQSAGSTSQAAYEAEVARITKENEAIDAENAKAKADYEAKKAAVQKANADAEKTYQEALKAYQAGKTSGETVKTKTIEDTTLAQKAKDAGVQLKPERVVEKDLTASTDLKADMAKVEAEAKTVMDKVKVRIPKGESMTVSYTRQDGKDYVNPWANFENYSLWVKKSTYDQKDKFTKPDFKGIHQYDLTITNDGSITENGDMMVFFTNDTVQPLYFGVSDMTSTPGKRTFKALPNKAELYGYHQKVQFRDSDGDILMPTIKQIGHANRNVPQQPGTGWNQSVKAKFTSPENAKVREFVGSAKTGTDTHGLNWDSNFKPVASRLSMRTS